MLGQYNNIDQHQIIMTHPTKLSHEIFEIISIDISYKVYTYTHIHLYIYLYCIYLSFIIQMYFEKNSHYGKQTFWQKRYAENLSEFDWYQDWAHLRDIVSQFITYQSKILNVGAGNSLLSEQMYQQGYRNITNIDFSEIVVDDMQTKYKKENYGDTLTYKLADVRNMRDFQDEAFDCVIDKGTLDSILCGGYSKQNSKKMLCEISRVLKNKGYYICVSYGDPEIRFNYFENKAYNWIRLAQCPYKIFKPNIDDTNKKIIFSDKDKQKNKDYYHYVYIMEKGSQIFQNIQSHMNTSVIPNNSTGAIR